MSNLFVKKLMDLFCLKANAHEEYLSVILKTKGTVSLHIFRNTTRFSSRFFEIIDY